MKENISENLLEWSEKIKKQKLSNKNAATWCKEQGISYNTFQYWRKRIKKINPEGPIKDPFLEIPEEHPLIEVSLRGIRLAISKDFDRSALVYFLSLLKIE